MAHGCTWHIGISRSSCERERLHTLHTLPISSQKSNDVKICQIMSNVFLPDSFSDLFGYVASPSRLSVEV